MWGSGWLLQLAIEGGVRGRRRAPRDQEVLVSAQTLEAFAVKEGAGATARELHELAATLFERA